MIILPADGTWIQRNRGDTLGDLQGTFNIDLTTVLGKTRATRMIQTSSQSTNADLTSYPVGFRPFGSSPTGIWTVAGSKVHVSAGKVANAVFSVDSTTGTPVDCDSTLSDIEIFGLTLPLLCVTANSKLYTRQDAGNWASNSFGGAGPWMMCVYAQRLYITVAGLSQIYSTANGTSFATSGTNTITLDTNQRPTCIRPANNRIWVGTMALSGKGYMYEWDGVTTQPTRGYRLEAQGVLACVIKDDIPWIVDTNGRLMQFQNGTFEEVARFPWDEKLLLQATNTVNNRPIHPNGMSIINGKINILVNNVVGDNGSTIPEFCPSGIWEYDDITYNQYTGASQGAGLYHKYSPSYLPVGTNTITDYGQNRVSGVGGLSEAKLSNSAANATGNLLAGVTVYTNQSSTDVGIFTNDTFDATSGTTGQYNTLGAGYIVTEKQFAQDEKGGPSVQNTWQSIYTLYEKLVTASSKINVKYRTVDNIALYPTITWTSTTTFTTTTNVVGLEGYEVEIIQGTGSGLCSHITKVDVAGSTYTVTVDETYTGATSTAKARIQNWKKKSSIAQSSMTADPTGIGDLSNWVQFKICMIFSKKDELQKLLIANQNTLPVH